MLAKLCALILCFGVVACGLLVNRQMRVLAAHDMADVQKRIARHDRELWKLRAEVARRVTPEKVRELAAQYGPLTPISAERLEVLVRTEADEAAQMVSLVDDARASRGN